MLKNGRIELWSHKNEFLRIISRYTSRKKNTGCKYERIYCALRFYLKMTMICDIHTIFYIHLNYSGITRVQNSVMHWSSYGRFTGSHYRCDCSGSDFSSLLIPTTVQGTSTSCSMLGMSLTSSPSAVSSSSKEGSVALHFSYVTTTPNVCM